MIIKNGKIKHKVFTNKNDEGYSVTEMTFDGNGNTVNHQIHGSGLSFKEANSLMRDIIDCYR